MNSRVTTLWLKEANLEAVLKVSGVVSERPRDAINSKMITGDIEIQVIDLEILSNCDIDNIPFLPLSSVDSTEDNRLKYRYLDFKN